MTFTYLIGAGASYSTLPIVKTFHSRLKEFTKIVENQIFPESINTRHIKYYSKETDNIRKIFIDKLNWLITEIDPLNHISIDSFARKIFLKNDIDNYELVKRLISEFMLYEELSNGVDNRYDNFFATLLSKTDTGKLELPNNIKIISWNYDKQFEFSIAKFFDKPETQKIQDFINIHPRATIGEETNEGFSIYKLNGVVGGAYTSDKFNSLEFDLKLIKNEINDKIRRNIIRLILERHMNYELAKSHIRFADDFTESYSIDFSWEDKSLVNITRQLAFEGIKNTEVLTVIGYSFPTFNRKLDFEILNSMKNLSTIYIQSPESSITGVNQRVKALINNKKIHVEPITNTDEFYIPFEFN